MSQPSGPIDPLALLRPEQVEGARGLGQYLRNRHTPPLRPDDIVGVVMLTLRPVYERQILSRGRPLDVKELRKCEGLALEAALQLCDSIAAEAGLVPQRLLVPTQAVRDRIESWWLHWHNELQGITDELSTTFRLPEGDPRRRMLAMLWHLAIDPERLDGDTLLTDLKAGLVKGKGRRLTKEEAEGPELSGTWREVLGSGETLFDVTFVGNDGRLHLGKTQIRDRIRAGEERERLREGLTHPLDADGSDPSQTVVSPEPGPLEELQELEEARCLQEQLAAVSAVVAARRARATRGSAEWHLLNRFRELASESLSPSALADEVGFRKSWMCECWKWLLTSIKLELTKG